MALHEPDDDGEEALDVMVDNGFESYFTIINLGSSTILFISAIVIPLLIILIL